MSIALTNPEIILTIQIIAIIGYFILGAYTLISYQKLNNSMLLFIAFAFVVIAISIILKVLVESIAETIIIEEPYLEATFEATQFLAAFLFFYGLRVIKREKGAA
ncbi:MAG: hypothetical protein ACTSR8_08045 [Promethearchaeota archaeon]